jgi:outer membrane protein assembly factor BamB
MSIDQLIFVGLNGYAVALDRDSGEIAWSNDDMESGYVTLLLDGDRLIVSANGYMYCLDPLTGTTLWHNPLKGYGVAPAAVVSARGQSAHTLIQQIIDNDSDD